MPAGLRHQPTEGRQGDVRARSHKPLAVEANVAIVQPLCCGLRTDEHEDIADRFLNFQTGPPSRQWTRSSWPWLLTRQSYNLGAGEQLDIRRRCDPIDQVSRHALGQAGSRTIIDTLLA
jgi:hypothetical protein